MTANRRELNSRLTSLAAAIWVTTAQPCRFHTPADEMIHKASDVGENDHWCAEHVEVEAQELGHRRLQVEYGRVDSSQKNQWTGVALRAAVWATGTTSSRDEKLRKIRVLAGTWRHAR